ncbi:fimbrial protein [Serratia ureilytica]|uniref:fimbrial protein n=1 Tax=Serratia ureilytica TaxID=300181 RepID=UPI00313D62CC
MKKTVCTPRLLLGLLGGIFCASLPVYAVEVGFKGQLVESIPCEVNSGDLIKVDFDHVIIRGIDGNQYRKPVPYNITCSGLGSVRLSVQGTAISFDDAAVVTDKSGLGIRVEQNGIPMRLNQPIPVDLANPPALTVVPVADPASLPVAGAFVALATLLADYQ